MMRSISLSGLLTLNLHSLNNEGTEGNVQMTRTVQVVDEHGDVQSVNAISGDMFKHSQCEYFRNLAAEAGVTMCEASARGDANRINKDQAFLDYTKGRPGGAQVIKRILETCGLTDCEGTLVVANKMSVPRKSCIEFGWVVGRPASTRTDSFLHVKYDPEGRGGSTGTDDNSGQALFHRPASSGQYAVTVHVELDRVGRNDITGEIDIPADQRALRQKVLLRSLLHTFVVPRGAQRNTQSPHVVAFEGVITASTSAVPAPAISALKADYKEQVQGIVKSLETLAPKALTALTFDSMETFATAMGSLVAGLGAASASSS